MTTNAATKKPWYKKLWIWGIVAAVVLIGGIGNAINGGTPETQPEPTVTAEASAPEETEAEPVAEEPTEEAPVADLAARTHAEYLNAWGVSDLIELAGAEGVTIAAYAIYEWEDIGAGTIRVYVQENLTKDEAVYLGENVLSLTGLNIEDLDTVVIRGADGIDVNTYRRNVPLLNQ